MIENYSSEWTDKYEREASKIKDVLGDLIIDIQHIGSTAVPGLSAKPIIDIAVLTESISDTDIYTEKLEKIGYIYKPAMSSQERIFLRKGDPVEYHLSISEPRFSYWKRQMVFRDYLRNHPEAVKEYVEIKKEAMRGLSDKEVQDPSMSDEYNSKKGPFIEKVLKLAQE